MTNPKSLKFDDDDVDDDELLAACNEVISEKPEPIVPTGNFKKKFSIEKTILRYSKSRNSIIRFSIRTIHNSSRFYA